MRKSPRHAGKSDLVEVTRSDEGGLGNREYVWLYRKV